MTAEEIKQKLIDNGFESLITTFEENHLLDEAALSTMTDADYQSIGVTILGDRKKLIYLFSNGTTSTVLEETESEPVEEFINIERNGKEFCYKDSEPGILLCRKCHDRVSEDDTLCSHCNNSLVHSDTPSISSYTAPSYSSQDNSTYIPPSKSKSPAKGIITFLVLAAIAAGIFFIYKSGAKSNYNDKLKTVSSKIMDSSTEAESCVSLIHSVWYNCIFEKSSSETNKYTQWRSGSYYKDFNDALNNLFNDYDFKKRITQLQKDVSEIDSIMKDMTNPPAEYREAYLKLNSCYEDYYKLVQMATSPSGNLSSFTQNFNNLDSSLASKLKSLDLYVK